MKKEVIELEAIWFGGGFHFRLADDKNGFVKKDSFKAYNILCKNLIKLHKNRNI